MNASIQKWLENLCCGEVSHISRTPLILSVTKGKIGFSWIGFLSEWPRREVKSRGGSDVQT